MGPPFEAVRHAQLLAALHNGAMVKPDKSPFTAADFWRDPWAPPAQEQDPQQELFARLDAFGWEE